MKKFFLTSFFTLSSVLSFAQSIEHLTFKNIPIDGTLNEYISKMKQTGFSFIQTANGAAILNGDFAGYKDCNVAVSTLKQMDLVHKIVVIFPDKKIWSTLSGNYFDLKQMLTEKYGNPSKVVEKFDGYSEPRDDNSRMYKVGMDSCKYYSIWETDKGNIELSISHDSFSSSFVILAYFDKINSNKIKSSAIDDL